MSWSHWGRKGGQGGGRGLGHGAAVAGASFPSHGGTAGRSLLWTLWGEGSDPATPSRSAAKSICVCESPWHPGGIAVGRGDRICHPSGREIPGDTGKGDSSLGTWSHRTEASLHVSRGLAPWGHHRHPLGTGENKQQQVFSLVSWKNTGSSSRRGSESPPRSASRLCEVGAVMGTCPCGHPSPFLAPQQPWGQWCSGQVGVSTPSLDAAPEGMLRLLAPSQPRLPALRPRSHWGPETGW